MMWTVRVVAAALGLGLAAGWAWGVPVYRVMPLASESVTWGRYFGYDGVDDSGTAYVNVVDDDPATDYHLRWDGTRLVNYLPPEWTVQNVSAGGHVLMQATSLDASGRQSAVWSVSGGLRMLAPPASVASFGVYGQAVNSRGVVAGIVRDPVPYSPLARVVTWSPEGVPTDLGVPASGFTLPRISGAGVLYGRTAMLPADTWAGATSLGFVGWGDSMRTISLPGFESVEVVDLNESGVGLVRGATGRIENLRTNYQIWDNGVLRPLPRWESEYTIGYENRIGWAINDRGQVVGTHYLPMLWDTDGTPRPIFDLLRPEDKAEWRIRFLWDINNQSVILAEAARRGTGPDGGLYLPEPVLLVPIDIPEPAWLGVVGAVGVVGVVLGRGKKPGA
jgi:hypothetical protein